MLQYTQNTTVCRHTYPVVWLYLCMLVMLVTACGRRQMVPEGMVVDQMNPMTPVKNQGKSQTCWAYAMLAAIETEHITRGDSVNLSAAYVEKTVEREPSAPENKRAMGQTCINLIQKYGVCGYDAMRTTETPVPRQVFMLGAVYTPQEFARSVCAPGEYLALTSNSRQPYYRQVAVNVADNWEHNRFYNVPRDTLMRHLVRAVRHRHGVCWESERHAMAVVGLAHDKQHRRYFILKNSWGEQQPNGGLVFMPYDELKRKTLALYMTHQAYRGE